MRRERDISLTGRVCSFAALVCSFRDASEVVFHAEQKCFREKFVTMYNQCAGAGPQKKPPCKMSTMHTGLPKLTIIYFTLHLYMKLV